MKQGHDNAKLITLYLESSQSNVALRCIAKHVSHIPARRVLFGPAPTLTQIFSISGEEVGKPDRALFHRGICSLCLHFLFDLV